MPYLRRHTLKPMVIYAVSRTAYNAKGLIDRLFTHSSATAGCRCYGCWNRWLGRRPRLKNIMRSIIRGIIRSIIRIFLQHLRDLSGALLLGVFLELLVGDLVFLPVLSFSDLFVARRLHKAIWKVIVGNKLKTNIPIKSRHQTVKQTCRILNKSNVNGTKISWNNHPPLNPTTEQVMTRRWKCTCASAF